MFSGMRVFLLGPSVGVVLALVSGLASAGFVLAPVVEHSATYRWQATPGDDAAALPLNPYRPVELLLTVPCSVVDRAESGPTQPVVTTTRGTAGSAMNLAVEVVSGRLTVRSRGQQLVSTTRRWEDCTALEIRLTSSRSTVSVDGRPLSDLAGDHCPLVRGFFTSSDVAGLHAVVVADTQYDTSPTWVKVMLGAVAVATLAGALLSIILRRPARSSSLRPAVTSRPARRSTARAWLLDGVVAVVLVYLAVVGPVTDDDGFIARIIRTRAASGFVGNYARWNNTPEAPFGWIYELYAGWSRVSFEPIWLRIPPLLLGLVSWWLLARLLLPRLLMRPALSVRVGIAAAFITFWICFGNTLRPEPWVALGLAVVMMLVDIAIVRRNLAVLALAATAAAMTLGVGPSGLVAFGPFLAAAPRLVRWFRAMAGWERVTGVLVILAGVAVATVPMFADQSLAAVRSGTAIRTGFGPSFPWWEDWRRYVRLTEAPFAKQWGGIPGHGRGIPGRRCGAEVWPGSGVRRSMERMTLGSAALVAPLMALAPTKLSHHFGALMLVGPLVVGLALHVLHDRPSPLLSGGAVAGLAVGLGAALIAPNDWWELSKLGIPNAAGAQELGGVALAAPVMAVGVLTGIVVAFVGTFMNPRGDLGRHALSIPIVGLLTLGLAIVLVAELGSFGYAAARRAGRYTLAAENLHALVQDRCLLEDTISSRTRPGQHGFTRRQRAG